MNSQIAENESQETSAPAAEAEMAKYGITRAPVDYFHYKEFCYTNVEDAVAQAKRDGAAGPESNLLPSDDEMARWGITRFPVDHFHYRQFRYTNLNDAFAQAKRDGISVGGVPNCGLPLG